MEFIALDAELRKLEAGQAPQEAFHEALERMVHASTRKVAQHDRLWWWLQLYSAMDRHIARSP